MFVIASLICKTFVVAFSSDPLLVFVEAGRGQNVTLVPLYVGDPSGISWWFRGRILTDIRLKPSEKIYFYSNFDRFKERAEVNASSGILIIGDLRKEDSGYYRAQTVINNVDQVLHIKLIVIDEQLNGIKRSPGSEATLDLKSFGDPTIIRWWTGPHILVEMKKPSEHIAFYRLKSRADVDRVSGRLTIRNLTAADSGVYRAEMLVDNVVQTSTIRLSVQ